MLIGYVKLLTILITKRKIKYRCICCSEYILLGTFSYQFHWSLNSVVVTIKVTLYEVLTAVTAVTMKSTILYTLYFCSWLFYIFFLLNKNCIHIFLTVVPHCFLYLSHVLFCCVIFLNLSYREWWNERY